MRLSVATSLSIHLSLLQEFSAYQSWGEEVQPCPCVWPDLTHTPSAQPPLHFPPKLLLLPTPFLSPLLAASDDHH